MTQCLTRRSFFAALAGLLLMLGSPQAELFSRPR